MADRRLLVWTVASFHAAGLTLAFVALAHAGGALSDLLAGLGTLAGFAGYGYLWALSYLATRWVLDDETVAAATDGAVRSAVLRGTVGGSLVGLGALLGPLLLVVVPDLVAGSANPGSIALVALIGSGVALAVGAVVGLAFALLDLAALRIVGRITPARDRR
ncbi:hypothetical protein [Halomicrobium salinisoli]|uniref:hypothetical protein n=1 Tax=Halomicrobium salinisoli TaxID=2878391 RepID=UPI001CF051C6|nr:hypothetical protein [Halomicrobium salinisoli]